MQSGEGDLRLTKNLTAHLYDNNCAVLPFDVIHNDSDLNKLIELIKGLPGELKVVKEYTGTIFDAVFM